MRIFQCTGARASQFGMGEPAFAQYIHGSDGLGDSDAPEPTTPAQERNAVIEIIDRVLASPGEITLARDRKADQRRTSDQRGVRPSSTAIDEVIVMGGAVTVPGNVTPVATANIWGRSAGGGRGLQIGREGGAGGPGRLSQGRVQP